MCLWFSFSTIGFLNSWFIVISFLSLIKHSFLYLIVYLFFFKEFPVPPKLNKVQARMCPCLVALEGCSQSILKLETQLPGMVWSLVLYLGYSLCFRPASQHTRGSENLLYLHVRFSSLVASWRLTWGFPEGTGCDLGLSSLSFHGACEPWLALQRSGNPPENWQVQTNRGENGNGVLTCW